MKLSREKGDIKMIKLAPSILSADFARLLEDVKKVEKAGCEYLHIDVMDGHFVPNITLGPQVVKSLRKNVNMVFDAHLMIENPDKYIKDFVDAGCDIIVVHQEACPHLHRTIQNIKSHNVKAGVALNPATPIETIKHIISDVDMILIMTVNPGFGGQTFIENMIDKIKELKNLIDSKNLNVDIQVDGGIKPENVKCVVDAGANVIVAGSAIFNSDDISKTVKQFRENAGN
jgi:ribulose-phosphate 3-epimerase